MSSVTSVLNTIIALCRQEARCDGRINMAAAMKMRMPPNHVSESSDLDDVAVADVGCHR